MIPVTNTKPKTLKIYIDRESSLPILVSIDSIIGCRLLKNHSGFSVIIQLLNTEPMVLPFHSNKIYAAKLVEIIESYMDVVETFSVDFQKSMKKEKVYNI